MSNYDEVKCNFSRCYTQTFFTKRLEIIDLLLLSLQTSVWFSLKDPNLSHVVPLKQEIRNKVIYRPLPASISDQKEFQQFVFASVFQEREKCKKRNEDLVTWEDKQSWEQMIYEEDEDRNKDLKTWVEKQSWEQMIYDEDEDRYKDLKTWEDKHSWEQMIYEDDEDRNREREINTESGPKERKTWREDRDPGDNRIWKKSPFYNTMFRWAREWDRGVVSSLWLPCSVIAGLNWDRIFSQRETIFCAMLFAGCEGCCNLAPRLGRNTVPQLGHHKEPLH